MYKTAFLKLTMLILCLALVSPGCSNNKSIDMCSVPQAYSNSNDLTNLLSNQNYQSEQMDDKKCIYVFTLEDNSARAEKFEVINTQVLNLSLPKNKEFILSLVANKEASYSWTITNEIDESILNQKDTFWIKSALSLNKAITENNQRQNFYFQSLRSGKQTLKIGYSNNQNSKENNFNASINLTIQ